MRVFITGGTGFIGRHIIAELLAGGHEVTVVSRSSAKGRKVLGPEVRVVEGDPAGEGAWQEAVGGCDAVINLCGEPILAKKWTPARKQVILNSRLQPTRRLVEAMAAAPNKPQVFLSGSAIGYYGDRGDDVVTEGELPGTDFGAELNVKWEAEADRATELGVRVVNLRTGFVLDKDGGGLPRLAMPFRFFMGGHVAGGGQYMSWVHIRDYVAMVVMALENGSLRGPMNLTAPNPVTNRDLSKALGRALAKPSWLPTPAFVFRLMFGEGAALLVEGQRVIPRKALDAGFKFKFESVDDALEDLFGPGQPAAQ